jgi:hypothetical protein
MQSNRWKITLLILFTFFFIVFGIVMAVMFKATIEEAWKELLLILLGAFVGNLNKVIDFWFSNEDRDKMLVQKMDEEDGISMSHTNDMKETNKPVTPLIPDAFVTAAAHAHQTNLMEMDMKKDQQEHDQMMSKDQQEHEQEMEKLEFEHQVHRQCEHVWVDSDYDGDLECEKCGKIKD